MARATLGGAVAGLLVVAVAAVCIRLGFWQLDRLEQRRARNAALEQALVLPPVELNGPALDSVLRHPSRFRFRRARAVGRYDAQHDVVLRGRASGGRPGVHLVTPLQVGGGDTVLLVDRGWVPAADAATVDVRPLAESGTRQVEGILQPVSTTGEPGVALATGEYPGSAASFVRLDLAALRASLPYTVLPVYLQLLPGAPGNPSRPAPAPLPEPGEGPHLGYAVQWFSFAAIAVVGFLILVLRRRRPD